MQRDFKLSSQVSGTIALTKIAAKPLRQWTIDQVIKYPDAALAALHDHADWLDCFVERLNELEGPACSADLRDPAFRVRMNWHKTSLRPTRPQPKPAPVPKKLPKPRVSY